MARKKQKRGKRKSGSQGQNARFLRVRTTGIRILNQCAFVALVLLGCLAVALLAVPEVKELQRLEAELTFVEEQEEKARQFADQKERELEAIREDPEYLETISRDRLNLHRKGETIIRIKRETDL